MAFDGANGSSNSNMTQLTAGERIGLVLAAEASLLSCICVMIIFLWIGWNIHWYKKKFPGGNWKLFQGPVDIYMFSLFLFDFLQTIGGILNIKWAHNGIVKTGPYCTAQGLIEQIGDLGVALSTLFLALHTFVAAVWQIGLNSRGVALSLVCLTCVFITLWVAIGASTHKNYETPTPFWCWISPHYSQERLGGEYLWMWIALFASAILYIPLYFWAEGFWSIDEDYTFHWWDADRRVEYAQRRAALGMLLYPLGYSLVVLPLTVARWLQFSHHHVSSAGTFFAVSMFYLSGAINVLLFLIIRPGLLLFPRPEKLDEQDVQLTHQEDSGPSILSDTKFQHSPGRTSAVLGDEGPTDDTTPSHINSGQMSDEIEV